ncbi:MAG: bacteriocin [Prevotellaceae bacterium]|nr:bacteriocin [Candidatus Faecinaster equi]
MAKTKEELNALKEEVESVTRKIHELTDEELEQVSGGQRIPVYLFPGAPPIYIGDDN